jgi:hypothetical protein
MSNTGPIFLIFIYIYFWSLSKKKTPQTMNASLFTLLLRKLVLIRDYFYSSVYSWIKWIVPCYTLYFVQVEDTCYVQFFTYSLCVVSQDNFFISIFIDNGIFHIHFSQCTLSLSLSLTHVCNSISFSQFNYICIHTCIGNVAGNKCVRSWRWQTTH